MYNGLVHAHSGLRWIFLAAIIIAVVVYGLRLLKGSNFKASDKKWALIAMIFAHIQLLIGLVLYFISPEVVFNENTMSDSRLRFYAVEHISVMIIGIILITLAYRKVKTALSQQKGYAGPFWFLLIGLLLILSRIPWPGQGLGAAWF